MFPIYFCGNYNRYRKHNSNSGQRKFLAIKHCFHIVNTIAMHSAISKHFSWAERLRMLLVIHITVIIAEIHYPLSNYCIHISCCISININGCNFAAWFNSLTLLCFVYTFMPDAILPDCYLYQGKNDRWVIGSNFLSLMSWASIIKLEVLLFEWKKYQPVDG